MKKIFQKFFKGYAVLEEVQSPINGKIQVREDWLGRRILVVGGITQSGGTVEKIWELAIRKISSLQSPVSSCLILGLGAGNAARIVNQYFPGAKITGIEIDPEMIRLGKKYFGLAEGGNLKIKIEDAVSCSNDLNLPAGKAGHDSRKFDLILMDLYLGDSVPQEAEKDSFLQNICWLVSSSGIVIFNRLYYANKKEKTDKFGEKLKKIFTQIEAKKVLTNKLFLCQQ